LVGRHFLGALDANLQHLETEMLVKLAQAVAGQIIQEHPLPELAVPVAQVSFAFGSLHDARSNH
jgi:malic enzyme